MRLSYRPTSLAFRRPGFTLLEATMSLVIVSVMLTSVLATVGAFARSRSVGADQSRSMLLAQQLMSEIVQYPYYNPASKGISKVVLGPDAGQTRSTFDDVGDFAGWSESPPADRTGTALAGFTGWKRSVAVNYVSPTNPTMIVLTDQGLMRIVVTVTSASGKVTSLTALRSNNGAYERSPSSPTTFNSWVSVNLQAGSNSGASVSSSTDTVNLIP
jgi:MSHA pilin protein MshD